MSNELDENRMFAIIWGIVGATLLALAFVGRSCEESDNARQTHIATECLKAGGQWHGGDCIQVGGAR